MHAAFVHFLEGDIVHDAVRFVVVIDEDVVSGDQGLLQQRLLDGWSRLAHKRFTTHISQNQNYYKIQ